MRIRHFILSLLVPALLCSCGKETVPGRQDGEMPIGFAPTVTVGTKAVKPDDPTVLIAEGNKAAIFGDRVLNLGLPSETSERILNNRELICDAVPDPATPGLLYSSVWSYSPLEYWEDTGDYFFAGVFPHGIGEMTRDNAFLNVTYLAGNNADLMVARAYRNVGEGKAPVNLSFKHATSAVRFLFGKASDAPADNYSLTSFKLESLVAGGTLKVQMRLTDPSSNPITLSNWKPGTTSDLASWTAVTEDQRKPVPHPADADDPDGYLEMGWYYMVPQTLTALSQVRFSVAYNDETPVETVLSISDRDGLVGLDDWQPNCVYNYYITLTQSGLDLTVKAIPWDEVQVITDEITF